MESPQTRPSLHAIALGARRETIVECRDVRRSFGERRVLDGVSFGVARGEMLCVLGESGSGKSTLLAILGALDRGYTGSVTLFDRDLASMDDREASRLRGERIGFIFQGFQLLPHLSALDNVAAPALFARTADDPRVRAMRLLHEVGLGDRAHDRPESLSGGQRQRVAIARALFVEPKLLLCDEPTGNLDRATGEHVVELVADVHARGEAAIVVATHDERFAQRATRTLRLEDGKLVTHERRSGEHPSVGGGELR